MIKIGLAIGTLSWGSYNNSAGYNFDGSWTDNSLLTGLSPSGYFGFGV